ncbi:MAG: SEC-C metal-binding domain-containing protein [Thermodesulfobacteriota bacterium]
MARIGRNDPCPCGSGKKFKKCCIDRQQAMAAPSAPPSLNQAVALLQQDAAAKRDALKALGVFVLFSTASGDGWLLEVTEMDAIQVARGGESLAVEIVENPETIEINWTHKFAVRNKNFVLTAYADKSEQVTTDYPTQRIAAAIKKIMKRIPPELLQKLHVAEEAATA